MKVTFHQFILNGLLEQWSEGNIQATVIIVTENGLKYGLNREIIILDQLWGYEISFRFFVCALCSFLF